MTIIKSPLKKGDKGGLLNICKTRPHKTRPRKNGEWGKEDLHGKSS